NVNETILPAIAAPVAELVRVADTVSLARYVGVYTLLGSKASVVATFGEPSEAVEGTKLKYWPLLGDPETRPVPLSGWGNNCSDVIAAPVPVVSMLPV